MLIYENLYLAIAAIKANKMRALLTMLGIIIGISSVLTIMSIGEAIKNNFEKTLKDTGMENITIEIRMKKLDANGKEVKTDDYYYDDSVIATDDDYLSLTQLNEIKVNHNDLIDGIALSKQAGQGEVRVGNETKRLSILGINNGYGMQTKVEMIRGRYIEDKDVERARPVVLVPESLASEISKDYNQVIGSELVVSINEELQTYVVVGIFKKPDAKGLAKLFGDAEELYIPVSVASEMVGNERNFSMASVIPSAGTDSNQLVELINKDLKELYKGNRNFKGGAYSSSDQTASFTGVLDKISLGISVIAGISLLVGGIGVMNIMLVSVTERTKEIGTRKALGARDSAIKLQFIIEAVIICAIGGVIGIILGQLAGAGVAKAVGISAGVPIGAIVGSVLFSMGIGIFFGYYPAKKAADLDPIEALRYE